MVKKPRTDPGRARAEVGAIRYGTGSSPLGPVLAGLTTRGVCGLFVVLENDPTHALGRLHHYYPGAELIEDQGAVASLFPRLTGFLYGHDDCSDLAIDFSSGTPFQQRVWESLRKIPRGETRSYGEVAQAIGHPGAARAVGTACGLNPVSLLIPCHRVVASGGGLGGYGWGPERKQALLDLERS